MPPLAVGGNTTTLRQSLWEARFSSLIWPAPLAGPIGLVVIGDFGKRRLVEHTMRTCLLAITCTMRDCSRARERGIHVWRPDSSRVASALSNSAPSPSPLA